MKLKFIIALLLCLSLVGCSKSNNNQESSESQTQLTTTQEVTTQPSTPVEQPTIQVESSMQNEVPTWSNGEPRGYMEIARIINDNPNLMMHVCRYIENSAPWDFDIDPADELVVLKEHFYEGKFEEYATDMTRWFNECQEIRGFPPGTPLEDEMLVRDGDTDYYISYNEYIAKYGDIPPRDALPNKIYPDEIRAGMRYTLDCTYEFYYVEQTADMYITMYHDGMHIFDIVLDLDLFYDKIISISATRVYE